MSTTNIMRLVVFLTAGLYFAFYLWDRRHVKDERENLIELKATYLQQQISIWGFCIITLLYVAFPDMEAIWPILVFALTTIYAHILGKIFYRRRM